MRLLGKQLLHTVFSESAQSAVVGFSQSLDWMEFRDGKQLYIPRQSCCDFRKVALYIDHTLIPSISLSVPLH